jgi:beta-ureidopropionase / N-carbamoyl-L-amino-acid hydrolase
MDNTRIDRHRLWASLMEMAKIGATPKGGVHRLALDDDDWTARDLLVQWCREAGCSVRVDKMGNIFARRPGRSVAAAPVMAGSHLDSQPTGGKFDGALGVMAALEVIRTLNDLRIDTEYPVELVCWTNEEGSRFSPAMLGSGVFAGVFPLVHGLGMTDQDGRTVGEELKRIGYAGREEVGGSDVDSYFEVHIEQGPILETEGIDVGVVTGAVGQRWYDVTLTGQEAHAGPTPMDMRRDALLGACEVIDAVYRSAVDNGPDARATVGHMRVYPNSRNVVPGRVTFSVDLRHPDDNELARMDSVLSEICLKVLRERKLELGLHQLFHFPPTEFDAECVGLVRDAAERSGYSVRDVVSGAGHDAIYMQRVAPSGMIFVPCEGGISHNEAENISLEVASAGCQTLFNAVLGRANRERRAA